MPWPLRLSAVLMAVLFAAWCALLAPQWLGDANLTHGLFMPVVLAALLYEGARSGSTRYLPDTPAVDVLQAAVALGGLLTGLAGGSFAALMGWDHSLADFLLTLGMAGLLLALLMAASRAGARAVPFAWPCLAAVLLCVLCAPLPPGTAARLTALLQQEVTESVLQTLNALGVPAFRRGNIIELAHARLGVDEACSGLRSLVSCIFAGIFISAAWVRRTGPRILIVALAAPLALAMNLLRSLALAFAAERGLRIGGLLHDAAGLSILAATSVALVLLGAWLSGGSRGETVPAAATAGRPRRAPGWIALLPLLAAVALVASWAVKPLEHASPAGRLPDLAAILPDRVPGWEASPPADLREFAPELRTGCLFQRTYSRLGPSGREEVTLYVAYWRPGQASVTSVSSHTPDMCWPGQGWAAVPEHARTLGLRVARRTLPPAQARAFARPGERLNVWYWHLYGGRPVEDFDTHSPLRLLAEAAAHGVRADRSQIFVRISANAGWSQIGDGALLPVFFSGLRRWGL